MKRFKKSILFLHRWLGLISGLVVFVVSITGCIYVFQKEIGDAMHRRILLVQPDHRPVLPLSRLQAVAQQVLGPGRPVNFIEVSRDPQRAWAFMAFKGNNKALTYFGAIDYYQTVYVNPYSGKVTGTIDDKHDFFNIVKFLHWSLLLNTPYGQPVVGWSTLIFVLLLISGIILWWPKRKKRDLEQAFTIKWKARWRRVNYDLHNVLGFYVTLLALVLAFTGMVWAFSWFRAAVYVAVSATTQPPQEPALKSVPVPGEKSGNPLDLALADAWRRMPAARRFSIQPPLSPDAVLEITGNRDDETYYDTDELNYDRYSGRLLAVRTRRAQNRGERLVRMNYDIHVGAIAGLPGKIMAFLGSLICASLPVTGFLVWWGKGNKKSKSSGRRGTQVQRPVRVIALTADRT